MDAEQFLRTVVPADGIKYLGVLAKDAPRPAHYQFEHYGQMAQAAQQWDARGADVYFALASYKPATQATDKTGALVFHPDGRPKMLKRTASLALNVQSFWADLDCGEGKPYQDQEHALAGLGEFIAASGCPAPITVSSGWGVHCYWPFERPVLAAQWVGWAQHWRRVLHHFNLHSDPQRDMDVASILRVPGTHNHKRDEPRDVVVLDSGVVSPTTDFFHWLASQVKVSKPLTTTKKRPQLDMLSDRPDYLAGDEAADELVARALPRDSAVQAAKHCAQLKFIASVRGDVSEPMWRAMLGVVKNSAEGEALAHEWSAGHPEYDADAAQEKMDRWVGGPTTCATFRQLNPSMCDGCPHAERVKSPIQLGVVQVEQAIQREVKTDDNPKAVVHEIRLPRGYIFTGDKLCMQMVDGDGVVENVPFARTLFHAVTRIRTVDEKYELRVRVYPVGRGPREFTVPTGDVTANTALFHKMLGDHEVIPTNHQNSIKMQRSYLMDEVVRLQNEGVEMVTFDQFGWHEDNRAFLYGNHLYRAQGPTEVLLGDGLRARTEIGPRTETADAEEWGRNVNALYDRPGLEPWQYTIVAALASPLAGLVGPDYNGCALCLTGYSGRGKTTAAKLAMSIWGNPAEMLLAQKEGATANARIHRQGAYQNLPVLHDEVGSMKQEEAQALLYSLANGAGRNRLDSTGTIERTGTRWKSHPILTSNKAINELVNSGRGAEAATAMRNFEIYVDDYAPPSIPMLEVDAHVAGATAHYGAAGRTFISHVLANRDEVTDMMFKLQVAMVAALPVLERETQFRLYRMHAQCSLTALLIARKIGLLRFKFKPLFNWVVAHIGKLCEESLQARDEQQKDAFAQLVNDIALRLVVTTNFHDARTNQVPEEPHFMPRGDIAGRYVVGCPDMPSGEAWFAGKLMLSTRAITLWCGDHGIRPKAILEEAKAAGIYVGPMRIRITRGTELPGLQVPTHVFDLHKVPELAEALSGIKLAEVEPAE